MVCCSAARDRAGWGLRNHTVTLTLPCSQRTIIDSITRRRTGWASHQPRHRQGGSQTSIRYRGDAARMSKWCDTMPCPQRALCRSAGDFAFSAAMPRKPLPTCGGERHVGIFLSQLRSAPRATGAFVGRHRWCRRLARLRRLFRAHGGRGDACPRCRSAARTPGFAGCRDHDSGG